MGKIKCWISKDGTEETEEDYSLLYRIWILTLFFLWLIAFLIQSAGVFIYCKYKVGEHKRLLTRCAYISYFTNMALIVVWTNVFGSMLRYSDAG